MISIEKTSSPRSKPDNSKLGFGHYFTDHMFCLDYDPKEGWNKARIQPLQPIQLHPSASVLQYGQSLFEGLKAFRQKDGSIGLFRPQYNWRRITDGAERLCMIAPPEDIFLKGIEELLKIDSSWVPSERGCSLYLRPTLIGTEAFLGVRPSEKYLFYVLLSPVGSYYKDGLKPVRIWVEEKYIRAAPGGLGATKAGANYASSLRAALEAKKRNYDQVLWMDPSHTFIEEVGTMNIFFVIDDKVVTPALNGTILAGGVRDSVITLLRSWGVPIEERPLAISEIVEAHHSGLLSEAFGSGTAAVISPVGELAVKGEAIKIGSKNAMGSVATRLYDELTGIQYGELPDIHNWIQKIKL